jgi:hypothetical protein
MTLKENLLAELTKLRTSRERPKVATKSAKATKETKRLKEASELLASMEEE